jgi:hypothetical protein
MEPIFKNLDNFFRTKFFEDNLEVFKIALDNKKVTHRLYKLINDHHKNSIKSDDENPNEYKNLVIYDVEYLNNRGFKCWKDEHGVSKNATLRKAITNKLKKRKKLRKILKSLI